MLHVRFIPFWSRFPGPCSGSAGAFIDQEVEIRDLDKEKAKHDAPRQGSLGAELKAGDHVDTGQCISQISCMCAITTSLSEGWN